MPNMEYVIDLLAEQLNKPKGGSVYDPWHATRVRKNFFIYVAFFSPIAY